MPSGIISFYPKLVTGKMLTKKTSIFYNKTVPEIRRIQEQSRGLPRIRRLAYFLRKEVIPMILTLTFHVRNHTYTIQFRVKSNNRHSGK